jgi:hypothetical protein
MLRETLWHRLRIITEYCTYEGIAITADPGLGGCIVYSLQRRYLILHITFTDPFIL